MTRVEFIQSLARGGYYRGEWRLDDGVFDPLSGAFVLNAWPAWVDSLPPELKERIDIGNGVSKWFPKHIPECFDCNHKADSFGNFLDLCMAVDSVKLGKPRGEGGTRSLADRFRRLRLGCPLVRRGQRETLRGDARGVGNHRFRRIYLNEGP